jgi:hypothetical protein
MKVIRPKRKWEAVLRILSGEKTDAVARDLGIDAALLKKWVKVATRSARGALRYTMEEWELPTLRDLEMTAQKGFPIRHLHKADSAVCFFVAQFFGKNDIYHVYKSGIPEVTLVDLDEKRLSHMKTIYPSHWKYEVGDAFEVAESMIQSGNTYDLVTCDPFTSLVSRILENQFRPFSQLARKCYMQLIAFDRLPEKPASNEPEDVAKIVKSLAPDMKLLDVVRRSTHAGGVYWVVFAPN